MGWKRITTKDKEMMQRKQKKKKKDFVEVEKDSRDTIHG